MTESELVSVEIIFCSKDGNACLYDFGNFAVVLTYWVEDAFMPLGIHFEILLDKKYTKDIGQWMKKFRDEDFFAHHNQWSSSLIDMLVSDANRIHEVARIAEKHPDPDNLLGIIFTEIFPKFPN